VTEPQGPVERQPLTPADAPGIDEMLDEAIASVIAEEGLAAAAVEGDVAQAQLALAELTNDLQRVQAEYANYRRRVDRDRDLIRENAVGGVLTQLLSLLDDIERARQHGELEGAFKTVGESLEATVTKLGLEPFGDTNEAFDPMVHEALTTESRAEITEPTVISVYQSGYRFAGRVLRPARVAVAGTD